MDEVDGDDSLLDVELLEEEEEMVSYHIPYKSQSFPAISEIHTLSPDDLCTLQCITYNIISSTEVNPTT